MNRLLLFLLLFLPTIAFAQLYGTGVGYTMGVPTHTPNIAQKGSEACISIEKKMLYLWNRDSLKWKPTAAITVKFGAPTLAPGTGETRTVVNMQTGLLYWWNGTAWKELIAYSVELASAYSAGILDLFATDIRGELADSTAAAYAYADSLHLADNDRDSTNELQNLVLIGTVLNITEGNAVDFASLFANYLLKSDTSAMLGPYISLAGWGLLKSASHTLRVDTAAGKVATRYYVGTNPTTIANTRIAVSNGSNWVGYANFNYTDTRPTLTLGTASVTSTSTPSLLDLGNSFSSVAGSNPKILLFSSASTYGIGVSSSQMDYIVGNGANHSFWSTGTKTAYIDVNSIRLPTNKTVKFDAATATATTVALDLFGGTYGLGAFGSFINYITPTGGGHSFYVASNVAARINSNSNLLIGTTTDVTQSILTTSSTTKGSLPFPRMTTTERNAITGTAHLTVGNTTTNTTDVYDAVAGAWTSYGRLNATQSWTGTNTFVANGGNGAFYWATSNSSFAAQISAGSVRNTPTSGDHNRLGVQNGANIGWKNGSSVDLMLWGGSLGSIEFYAATSSGISLKIRSDLLTSISNNGQFQYTPSRNISNIAVNTGNVRNFEVTPSISFAATNNTIVYTNYYYSPSSLTLNGASHRFIETVSGDWYVGSTSGVMGIRTAPDAAYEIRVGGDGYFEDSLRVGTRPTMSSATDIAVYDANGWLGKRPLTGLGGIYSSSGTIPAATLAYSASTSEFRLGYWNTTLANILTRRNIVGYYHSPSTFTTGLVAQDSTNQRYSGAISNSTDVTLFSKNGATGKQTLLTITPTEVTTDNKAVFTSAIYSSGTTVSSGTSYSIPGNVNFVHISGSTIVTVNLPEIVNSPDISTTQCGVGASFELSIANPSSVVTIQRSGSADLILFDGGSTTGVSSTPTTAGVTFSRRFRAVAIDQWIIY